MRAHLEDLRAEVQDDGMVEAFAADWRTVELPARTRAALSFAEQVAAEPGSVSAETLEPLRRAGFDDEGILDIVSVVALFAYYNTMADALGVELEPEWKIGSEPDGPGA